MSISLTLKSIVCNKIPPFVQQKFSTWKSKAMDALDFIDFDMLDVTNKGPITAMDESTNDGVSGSKVKGKSAPGYNKDEKRIRNLDIQARAAIQNSLPFFVYPLVQICS